MAKLAVLQAKQGKLAEQVEKKREELSKAESELEALNTEIVAQLLVENNMTMGDLVKKVTEKSFN
ncbi:hypothetical protein WOSG25_090310 [Weissella oryzae SG25]|uniref:Uncharacterized protein n=1 Tax=Weissella oryzae (strain DSM 25784 / JCM 18191 / LMG 30913 / SG25) TaxID=1329250 RepID=A0A069CV58_WEIOS|nr:hypothetical protein [Weissella oryzae]GAK31334.1 hypothetical protein WOSG25_090310 [Weissella oryzae SG25]